MEEARIQIAECALSFFTPDSMLCPIASIFPLVCRELKIENLNGCLEVLRLCGAAGSHKRALKRKQKPSNLRAGEAELVVTGLSVEIRRNIQCCST